MENLGIDGVFVRKKKPPFFFKKEGGCFLVFYGIFWVI